jgi:imidazoleglycerol phosphate synthase glutamine amidotransferase subunit HisH
MSLVSLLDYGGTRHKRLALAFESLGVATELITSAEQVEQARCLVLPDADDSTLPQPRDPALFVQVVKHIEAGRPLLAIGCGLSLLSAAGVGYFDVPLFRFKREMIDSEGAPLRSPHMGYSFVVGLDRYAAFAPFAADKRGMWLYFHHRYSVAPRVPGAEVAVAHHGVPFAGAIWKGSVLACQFIPELSGKLGLSLLSAWMNAQATHS